MRKALLIALLVFATVCNAGWGSWNNSTPTGGLSPNDTPTSLFNNLESPYPEGPVRQASAVTAVYAGGSLVFTARAEPENGYSALVVRNLYINPGYPASSPTPVFMDNYQVARCEVMLIGFDGAVPDTATKIKIDTTVRGGYIPRSGLEGLFQWPITEGTNGWVTLSSSDRSSTQHAYASVVHLNMEAIDSVQVWLRPYIGVPYADTTWTGLPSLLGNFYCGVEWQLIPNKSQLYGRRLAVQYTRKITKCIDYICGGLTPAGKSGFVRMYAYGYGGDWNCTNASGASVRPWSASAPYTELRSVRPTVQHDKMMEEDPVLYRKYPPVITTLSAGAAANAASITINAPALPWASYVPDGNEFTYEGGFMPVLVYNNSDPVDTTSYYCRKTTVVDNGNNTWTLTFVDVDADNERNGNFKPIHALDAGDTVVLTGNWLIRGTGGEDWPMMGGYYNLNAVIWAPTAGFPAVRGSNYALDSVLANGTSIVRGCSMYRMFGLDDNGGGMPLTFDSVNRLWFYQQKTRTNRLSANDSLWHHAWEFESTIVYYTNDLLTPLTVYQTQSWEASAGDGVLEKTGGSAANYATTFVNATTANNASYTSATTNTYPITATADGSIALTRWFYPFATNSGSSPWVATGKTIKRCWLSFFVKSFDARNNSTSFSVKPYWSDSTQVWVTANTQASMTQLVVADYDNVGEDSLGGIRYSTVTNSSTKYTEVRIPVSTSVLVEGQDTKLALRMGKWDVGEILPGVGANRYIRSNVTCWSENTNSALRPRFIVEYATP